MFGLRKDIGIDLGTASVLVYIKNKGVILQEPSVVALDTVKDEFLAVGEDARRMLGKTPGNIVAIRPLKDGVISDYNITKRMLKYFIKKAGGNSLIRPRVVVCVPSGVTEVEKRAVLEATYEAGAKKAFLIEEPIAAAIGAGIDITEPDGIMIVDIGGGTTDVAVISLGGIVVSKSIKIAGDDFDNYIIKYIKNKYNMMIGERSAEKLKITVGTAYARDEEVSQEIKGRNLLTGLPTTVSINSTEMLDALREPVAEIVATIKSVLEITPPELASDISDRGIIMTGGGSLLYGIDKLVEESTFIETNLAEDPVSCVAKGTGKSLEWISILDGDVLREDLTSKYK